MHATQDVIHPEIGHQYGKESRNHIDVKEQRPAESGQALRMKRHSVHEERD